MTNCLKLTINTPSVKKAKLSYQESVSDNSCKKNFPTRGEQWSFFGSDGIRMECFFSREPLASIVFRWFCYPLTITINYILFYYPTIGLNGFSMVLGSFNHRHLMIFSPQTITFDGFRWFSDFRHQCSTSLKIYTQKSAWFHSSLMKYGTQCKTVALIYLG